jgi:hypothetical protein
MKAILANPKRSLEVTSIHNSIASTFGNLSLEDILIVGFNWKREKILKVYNNDTPFLYRHIKKFFYEWDYNNSTGQLSQFKLYNQVAITRHARYRAVFLQDMKRKGYDLSSRLSITQLEELSCHSINYATVTYAIKCYLLANFTSEQIETYKGIQPQTGPVHNANELMFGSKLSNYEHTVRCNLFAEELELSSTYINSAFYTMG